MAHARIRDHVDINDLNDRITNLETLKNPLQEQFIAGLRDLYQELAFRLENIKKHDEDANNFLTYTITLLDRLKQAEENYETAIQKVTTDNKDQQIVQHLTTRRDAQLQAIADYEVNCKQSALFGLSSKIIICIIFTGVFSVLGAIAGALAGFTIGGGVLSPFTGLAGLTTGAVTGAAIGAFLGTALTGIPAFAISRHFFFKPGALTQKKNLVAREAIKFYDHESSLVAPPVTNSR